MFIYFGAADKQRKAIYATNNRLEFTPNKLTLWAWLALIAYMVYVVYGTAIRFRYGHWNLPNVVGASGLVIVLAVVAAEFPGTIVLTAEGMEQVRWLWKNKYIRWGDIEEINTGEKSKTITITAKDGTKIVHWRPLPDRSRLLFELKQHGGENLPPDFPREPIADS